MRKVSAFLKMDSNKILIRVWIRV